MNASTCAWLHNDLIDLIGEGDDFVFSAAQQIRLNMLLVHQPARDVGRPTIEASKPLREPVGDALVCRP